VLQALTAGCLRGECYGAASDVDLFVVTKSRAEASRIARRVWYALAADDEYWCVWRSGAVLEMQLKVIEDHAHNHRGGTVQVILRLYESPAEVLLGFDVDCCCVGFDGDRVWALPRALRALRQGVNVLNPLHSWPQRASYEMRLARYAFRGYAVAVPALDDSKVAWRRLQQTSAEDFKELRGLARLPCGRSTSGGGGL